MQVGSVSSASALQSLQIQNQVDTAVLGKAQNAAEAEGQAAIALIESASDAITHEQDAQGGHGLDVTA